MLPISVVSVFCEDIREEKSGTEILIGIFPDNVNVPAIPGLFSKLSLYTRIHLDPNINVGPFTLWLRTPNGHEVPLGDIDAALIKKSQDDAKGRGFPVAGLISRAIMRPFQIPETGIFSSVVKATGGEEYIGGALKVQLAPNKTDSPTAP